MIDWIDCMEEPGECTCNCHHEGDFAVHCFPCCDGPCPQCGRNIIIGGMRKHIERAHPEVYSALKKE